MQYNIWPIQDQNVYFDMSPEEAKSHFEWLVLTIPKRKSQFLKFSQIATELNPWDTNSVEFFLKKLTAWLFNSCEIINLTNQDIADRVKIYSEPIRSALQDLLEKNPRTLSPLGFSFCVDARIIYLEILRARHPGSFWSYSKTKTHANRNIPVLKHMATKTENLIYGLAADILLPYRRNNVKFDLVKIFYEDDKELSE